MIPRERIVLVQGGLRQVGVDVHREYPGQIHAVVSLTKAIPQGITCTLEIAE